MNRKYYLTIKLSNNKDIRLCIESKFAPKTVENFVNLVKRNYYNGTIFHRIIKDFMVQTGGYYIKDNTLYEMEDTSNIIGEFKSNGIDNPLKHELGVISMARTMDKNSASSQFFICVNECHWLDGEYAAFGRTIDAESNNVILELSNVKTGVLSQAFSDFPYEPISIVSITIDEEKVED